RMGLPQSQFSIAHARDSNHSGCQAEKAPISNLGAIQLLRLRREYHLSLIPQSMSSGIFIRAVSLLSAQDTFGRNSFPEQIRRPEGNRLIALEPGYQDYLDPLLARRMGRIVKMGIATAI